MNLLPGSCWKAAAFGSQRPSYAAQLQSHKKAHLAARKTHRKTFWKRYKLSASSSEQVDVAKNDDLVLAAKLKHLKNQLKRAVSSEDYAKAVELRDAIREIESRDAVLVLKLQLQEAIAEQKYEEAARCRDELKRIAPEPAPNIPIAAPPPTTSDTVTNGVRIEVKSCFLPHRSRPGSYVFMYRIRIRNESEDKTVKLHGRHWIITDANRHQDIVRGVGVIGEQPELGPGEEHVYGSFAPIRTPTGKMQGSFQMQVKDESGEWQSAFDAEIGVFGLDMSDATPAKW